MLSGYIIGITVIEFQAWFNSGELRCDPGRLMAVPLGDSGKPLLDTVRTAEMIDLIPHVDLEEQHNVLIAQLALTVGDVEAASEVSGAEPILLRRVHVPIRCLRALYPLTQRAKQILVSRLESYRVGVGEPLEEAALNAFWSRRTWRIALTGGNELMRTLIHGAEFSPSKQLLADVSAAIEIIGTLRRGELAAKRLLPNVLCYDRHKPLPNTDIGYLGDLGVILKERFGEVAEFQPLIAGLRTYFKEREHSAAGICALLSDSRFADFARGLDSLPGTDTCVVSLVLFLKWKHQAQRAGAVACEPLMDDLKNCAGRLTREALEQAVWLFGVYCGFEKIAAEVYARRPAEFCFVTGAIPHEPCVLMGQPSAPATNDPAAPVVPGKQVSGDGTVASVTAGVVKPTEEKSQPTQMVPKEENSSETQPPASGAGKEPGAKSRKPRGRGVQGMRTVGSGQELKLV